MLAFKVCRNQKKYHYIENNFCASFIPKVIGLHLNCNKAYNYRHLSRVAGDVWHATAPPQYDFLKNWQRNALITASYLHEVDNKDLKLEFPGVSKEGHLPIARAILKQCSAPEEFNKVTLEIINLVPLSSGRSFDIPIFEEWKFLVRDADQHQSLGEVGIARAYIEAMINEQPLFTPETPRCQTREELWNTVRNPNTYHRVPQTMIDRCYDQLLHLKDVYSGSNYFKQGRVTKKEEIVNFLLNFGQHGQIDTVYLRKLVEKHC